MNLEELLRAEVVGGRSSATSEDEESGWDGKALVEEELVSPGCDVAELSPPYGQKSRDEG